MKKEQMLEFKEELGRKLFAWLKEKGGMANCLGTFVSGVVKGTRCTQRLDWDVPGGYKSDLTFQQYDVLCKEIYEIAREVTNKYVQGDDYGTTVELFTIPDEWTVQTRIRVTQESWLPWPY